MLGTLFIGFLVTVIGIFLLGALSEGMTKLLEAVENHFQLTPRFLNTLVAFGIVGAALSFVYGVGAAFLHLVLVAK